MEPRNVNRKPRPECQRVPERPGLMTTVHLPYFEIINKFIIIILWNWRHQNFSFRRHHNFNYIVMGTFFAVWNSVNLSQPSLAKVKNLSELSSPLCLRPFGFLLQCCFQQIIRETIESLLRARTRLSTKFLLFHPHHLLHTHKTLNPKRNL